MEIRSVVFIRLFRFKTFTSCRSDPYTARRGDPQGNTTSSSILYTVSTPGKEHLRVQHRKGNDKLRINR